jgi:cytochrome P450
MTVHTVSDHEGCIHALRQADLRQSLYDAAALMMEHVLVNLHGDAHRQRRTVESSVFRKDVFLAYEKAVLPRTLTETLAPYEAAGGGDLVDIGYRIMMNLTVDFAGIDRPQRTPEETGELLALLKDFSLAPALGQLLDADAEPRKARIRAAMARFDDRFLQPSLSRRRALLADHEAGRIAREDLPSDVLMALVLGQDRLQMTGPQLVQEGIFYMLAGAHTTIHSLTHAVHEILEWAAANPGKAAELRENPFFVQRCVYESVRLHPSSPVAKRRALAELTLASGAAVAPGDEVVVDLRAANRSEQLFGAAPDRFDPHRQIAKGPLPYGLSMGHGMHACLGRNLAIGVEPKPGSDPALHQYGVVPLIVSALLKRGITRDPAGSPQRDETITRITWSHYPILFRPETALL